MPPVFPSSTRKQSHYTKDYSDKEGMIHCTVDDIYSTVHSQNAAWAVRLVQKSGKRQMLPEECVAGWIQH